MTAIDIVPDPSTSASPTPVPTPSPARTVRHLVAVGDSTAVGIGDPLPGGGWRGFPALLCDALGDPGAVRLTTLARSGARMADTRHAQVPAAAALGADVVVLCAGMNDTLRSDFDAAAIGRDYAESLAVLRRSGAHVIVLRYHDHTRVFRLPAPLRRALQGRIAALNAALDEAVAGAPGVGVLDLALLPGGYEPESWSVDRLHPSERGHRLLARGLGELLVAAGWEMGRPVALECAGGRVVTAWHRGAWIVGQGLPWLVRRSRDLGPVIARGLVEGLRAGQADGRTSPVS
ncbi:SGNH/GDSL hydrolase family protein [Pseudonocardia endophytica]|uniref:Lysophospholipase L1-like esterase n=1 Tax=Pseudonocardia endophytica TaxID=401976 RepID=A0A4R1HNE4_PSEEN|nr:SGNH/GDSL hydrolase family protein [Pseudonocardia endophytica]TCK22711.1 lysophospholipase L1-like esterase [Pseudonocardia endophytica]